jgi:CheY-like chemotaxis protein
MSKPRILWVEDSAKFELANLLGPIYASNKYELTLAEDATAAVRYLQAVQFDAVIMDIRIPPGRDRYWSQQYERGGADKATAQLGLAMLSWLFNGHRNGHLQPPRWVRPEQYAVFSVEGEYEISAELQKLGIRNFVEKKPGLLDTVLLDLINRILGAGNGHAPRK